MKTQTFLRRAWAEVDLDALDANYRELRSLLPPGAKIMAVLKGNASNCGDIAVSRELERYQEDWYAVSNLYEALQIRQGGSQKPILILGYTPPGEARLLAEKRITQAIPSLAYAQALSKACAEDGMEQVDVHVKLNTGMNRLGLTVYGQQAEGSLQQAKEIWGNPYLHVTGTFTHLACLYEQDACSEDFSELQFERFMAFIDCLRSAGCNPGLRHCLNSAGAVHKPHMALDMVRPGTLLFAGLPEYCKSEYHTFSEILTVKAAVFQVRAIEPGMYLNYSMSYCADRPKTVAVLAIGYADFLRLGMGSGHVLLGGALCPVLGGVCMDQLTVDVSEAAPVQAGDVAVLLGEADGKRISVNDMESFLGADANEIYCHLTKRLPCVYIRGGKPDYWVSYEPCEHPFVLGTD